MGMGMYSLRYFMPGDYSTPLLGKETIYKRDDNMTKRTMGPLGPSPYEGNC